MPINKETIISVFDEKLTLMQWLKTINKALEDAVLTGVEINKKGNATLSFKFTFEDGTYLETGDLVLQQGESVNGAYISNGHLYLTLTNGNTLDAGNVKPVSSFSIDANQHLIVNYADGTSQDLGAIFSGDVNISGNLNVSQKVTANEVDGAKVTGNEIVEKMSGYSFGNYAYTNITKEMVYASACKNGNKLTFVVACNFTRTGETQDGNTHFTFSFPTEIGEKLYPTNIAGYANTLAKLEMALVTSVSGADTIKLPIFVEKQSNNYFSIYIFNTSLMPLNTKVYGRIEFTFLLSDNMAE